MSYDKQIDELIRQGESKGFLSYDEILVALADSNIAEDEIGAFYDKLQDKGIILLDDVSDDEGEPMYFSGGVELDLPPDPDMAPPEELKLLAQGYVAIPDGAALGQIVGEESSLLGLYLHDISDLAPLAPREENRLAKAAQAGDAAATERLVSHAQLLILTIAREFSGEQTPLLDLVQEGNLAIFTALQKYSGDFDFRIEAIWWLRFYLARLGKEEASIMRIPAQLAEDIKELQKKEQQLAGELERLPDDEELAKALDWDNEHAAEVRQFIRKPELLNEYLALQEQEEQPLPEEETDDESWWGDDLPTEDNGKSDLLHSMSKRQSKRPPQQVKRRHH